MLRGISLWVQHENPLLLDMCSVITRNLTSDCWPRYRSAIRNCVSRKGKWIFHEDPKQEPGSRMLHGDEHNTVRVPGGKQLSFPAHGWEVMV
jgi:hypothetical protein